MTIEMPGSEAAVKKPPASPFRLQLLLLGAAYQRMGVFKYLALKSPKRLRSKYWRAFYDERAKVEAQLADLEKNHVSNAEVPRRYTGQRHPRGVAQLRHAQYRNQPRRWAESPEEFHVARPKLTFISLFSGAGGLDLGLDAALGGSLGRGVYVEREAYALAVLASRIKEERLAPGPLFTDVCAFDARPFRGLVDVVVGGSPCQDLSVAGKRAGLDGTRSGLFYEFTRIVGECQPAIVAWENVGGAKRALPAVFAAFEELGYRGACVSVRASDVGAPHRRARFFLLAYRDETGRQLLGEARVHAQGQPGHDAARRGEGVGDEAAGRELGAAGADVADPSDARLQGSERAGASREGEGSPRSAAERGRAFWPPGPGDLDGWAAYLAAGGPAPAEPRVGRGAHGLAPGLVDSAWADRLRLLGNGVVPQQAAAAFAFLADHLTRENTND